MIRNSLKILIPLLGILFVFNFSFADESITKKQISLCTKDSECIIVPYQHCCGSTKRAINRKYLELYNSKPAWQKFEDREKCAVMGVCIPDKNMKSAFCDKKSNPPECRLQK